MSLEQKKNNISSYLRGIDRPLKDYMKDRWELEFKTRFDAITKIAGEFFAIANGELSLEDWKEFQILRNGLPDGVSMQDVFDYINTYLVNNRL